MPHPQFGFGIVNGSLLDNSLINFWSVGLAAADPSIPNLPLESPPTIPPVFVYVGHSLVDTISQQMTLILPGDQYYQVIVGAPLSWNWDHAAEASFNARAYCAANSVTDLVLTDGNNHAPYVTKPWIEIWRDNALTENPDIRTWWYQSWPNIPSSGTDFAAWKALMPAYTDAFEVQIQQLYLAIGLPNHPKMIPAGAAMLALVEAVEDSLITGITDPADLFSDDVHPDDPGQYFVAMVHYAALTGTSPVGLSNTLGDATVTTTQAAEMQALAWSVVSTYPFAGIADWPEPPTPTGEITLGTMGTDVVNTNTAGTPNYNDCPVDFGTARAGRTLVMFYGGAADGQLGNTCIIDPGGDAISVGNRSRTAASPTAYGSTLWYDAVPSDVAGTVSVRVNCTTETWIRGRFYWMVLDGATDTPKEVLLAKGDFTDQINGDVCFYFASGGLNSGTTLSNTAWNTYGPWDTEVWRGYEEYVEGPGWDGVHTIDGNDPWGLAEATQGFGVMQLLLEPEPVAVGGGSVTVASGVGAAAAVGQEVGGGGAPVTATFLAETYNTTWPSSSTTASGTINVGSADSTKIIVACLGSNPTTAGIPSTLTVDGVSATLYDVVNVSNRYIAFAVVALPSSSGTVNYTLTSTQYIYDVITHWYDVRNADITSLQHGLDTTPTGTTLSVALDATEDGVVFGNDVSFTRAASPPLYTVTDQAWVTEEYNNDHGVSLTVFSGYTYPSADNASYSVAITHTAATAQMLAALSLAPLPSTTDGVAAAAGVGAAAATGNKIAGATAAAAGIGASAVVGQAVGGGGGEPVAVAHLAQTNWTSGGNITGTVNIGTQDDTKLIIAAVSIVAGDANITAGTLASVSGTLYENQNHDGINRHIAYVVWEMPTQSGSQSFTISCAANAWFGCVDWFEVLNAEPVPTDTANDITGPVSTTVTAVADGAVINLAQGYGSGDTITFSGTGWTLSSAPTPAGGNTVRSGYNYAAAGSFTINATFSPGNTGQAQITLAFEPLPGAAGTTDGVAAAAGVGAAAARTPTLGQAAAAGVGTAAATGNEIRGVIASAAGVGAAAATGNKIAATTAAAAGVGAVAAASSLGSTASAAGVSAVAAIGNEVRGATAAASGLGAAAATGNKIAAATAAAAGTGAITTVASEVRGATIAASGTGSLTARSPTLGQAAAAGIGAAAATSNQIATTTASAAGVGAAGAASALGSSASAAGVGAVAAVGTEVRNSTGAATGLGTLSARTPTLGQAATAGIGAAQATSIQTAAATGAAAGAGVLNGVSNVAAMVSATAAAAGVGTIAATSASTNAATASAAGVGAVAAAGTEVRPATGAASGLGTLSARTLTLGQAAAAGVGAAQATGNQIAAATGAAAGVGAAQATSIQTATATFSAAGTGILNGVSNVAATIAATAAAAGVGAVVVTGASIAAATGSAAGLGAANSNGTGVRNSIGAAAGLGAVTATGRATASAVVLAQGFGVAISVPRAIHAVVGSAVGASIVIAVSDQPPLLASPNSRSFTVLAEDRSATVKAPDRVEVVDAEQRSYTVAA